MLAELPTVIPQALSELGAVDAAVASVYCRYGPTNRPPARYLFTTAPSDALWQARLAGQTRIIVPAQAALEAIRGRGERLPKIAPTRTRPRSTPT